MRFLSLIVSAVAVLGAVADPEVRIIFSAWVPSLWAFPTSKNLISLSKLFFP